MTKLFLKNTPSGERGPISRINQMKQPSEKPYVKSLSAILLQELQMRQEKNPRYSLRSFARDLQLSPAMLSLVINDNRRLSREAASRIAARLSLPILETIKERKADEAYQRAADEESLLSKWYILALFSLARFKNNSSTPEWIARRLGITPRQASKALNILIRLGLVEITHDRLRPVRHNIETQTDIPSKAIRDYHRQNLKRAIESLDKDVLENREIRSITLACSEKDMRLAKTYILNFTHRFCKKFETANATDVYTLSVQYIPATVKRIRQNTEEL